MTEPTIVYETQVVGLRHLFVADSIHHTLEEARAAMNIAISRRYKARVVKVTREVIYGDA